MSYIVAFWTKNLYSRGLFLSLLIFCCFSVPAPAQSVVFWNAENLFDTLPSPFYDDSEFTPPRWNTARYNAKITNLARTLDELSADLVGLSEVENESVVRDLVLALHTDYNYIHLSSGDSRGIDLALLYKGDKFFPATQKLENSGTRREFFHVSGTLANPTPNAPDTPLHLIVCHLASNLNPPHYRARNLEALRSTLETLLTDDPAAHIIVMGDMNASPGDKLVRKALGASQSPFDFMYCPFHSAARKGVGSYSFRDRWYLYDWMLLSPALARSSEISAGIYAKDYLTETTPTSKRPKRTFFGDSYLGGFSDHFPVWVSLVK